MTHTDLFVKMHTLADSGHARAAELREKANAFDRAANGFYGTPQTHTPKQLLGSWARAVRVWSECSGEPRLKGLDL